MNISIAVAMVERLRSSRVARRGVVAGKEVQLSRFVKKTKIADEVGNADNQ